MSIESVDVNTKDVVAYWKFNERAGTVSTDVAREARQAELVNAEFDQYGVAGTCVRLEPDGTPDRDRVELPYQVANGLKDFMFIAWIRINTASSDLNTIVSGANATQDNPWLLFIDTTTPPNIVRYINDS